MPEAESDVPSSSLDRYPDPSRGGSRKARGWDDDGTTRRGVLAGLAGILAVPGIVGDAWSATAANQYAGWPQYHGNARRTGRSAAGNPEEPTRTRWTLEVTPDGEGRNDRTAPIVAGGTMYIANADGNLVAVDVPSGTIEWSYTAAGGGRRNPSSTARESQCGFGPHPSHGRGTEIGRGDYDGASRDATPFPQENRKRSVDEVGITHCQW